jgi:hypothetical protein
MKSEEGDTETTAPAADVPTVGDEAEGEGGEEA